MHMHPGKTLNLENHVKTRTNSMGQYSKDATFQFKDNRQEVATQRKLMEYSSIGHQSFDTMQLQAFLQESKVVNIPQSKVEGDILPQLTNNFKVPMVTGAILQAKWIEHSKSEVKWDKIRDGLIWFYNNATRTMRFEPDGKTDLGNLVPMVGTQQSYRAWIKDWNSKGFINKDKADALSFSDYIAHIVEIYPPGIFEYVGIGASTDLVLGYLQRKHAIDSVNIPISGVTNESIDLSDQERWTPLELERVTKYITAFIPINILKGEKQILLMDVTSGGGTLNIMQQFVSNIVAANGGDPHKVRSFSLNTTVKPNEHFHVSKHPNDVPRQEPMSPEDVEQRRATDQELRSGHISAGTYLDEFTDMMDYADVQKIEAQRKELKQQINSLDSVNDADQIRKLKETRKHLKEQAEQETLQYDPKLFDMMITDTTDIESKLDNQEFKDSLGRSHRKVPISEIKSGTTDAGKEKDLGASKNRIQEHISHLLENEN